MPVNWSLLNPALPAAAQTINPFAALNAGRAQAEERIQNQQASELRGAQIEGLKREATQSATKERVRGIMARWREASQNGDQATAAAALQEAKGLDLGLVQATVAEMDKEEQEAEKNRLEEQKRRIELADKNAPLVIAAAAAEDKTPGAGKQMLQAAGAWDENTHGAIWSDPANRARMVQAAESMPSIIAQRAAEAKAQRDADAEARRLANDDRRTSAYVTNQSRDPTSRPSQTEEDMARYDQIARIPEARRTGAQKLFMQKFERAAQGQPSGADMYMNMSAQADAQARSALRNDPDMKDFAGDPIARAVFWTAFVRAQREGRMSPTQAAQAAKAEVMAGVQENETWYGATNREYSPASGGGVLEYVRDANGNIVPKAQ